MTSKKSVDEFIASRNFAIAGVSRNRRKFGNTIYRELKQKGYKVFPVNPNCDEVEGDKCYRKLESIPDKIDALVINLPPAIALDTLRQANDYGVNKIWLQQGSQSDEAVEYCEDNDIDCVSNECVLMFMKPTAFIHKFHRWIWGVAGKLPK